MLGRLIALLLLISPAFAQTGSPKTPAQLNSEVNTLWPDNTQGLITPFASRQTLLDMIASSNLITSSATYNASGLDTSFTGTIGGGSFNLTTTAVSDFKVGEGIWIPGAGPSNTAAVPTTGTVTVTCVSSCSNTLTYKIVGRDANGAFSAASSAMTANSSAAPASLIYSRDTTVAQNNSLTFTCGANDVDVLIYRGNNLIADVPCSDAGFTDYGQFAITAREVSATPPSSAGAAPLLTTVSSISGTSITLTAAATNAVSGGTIYHDDGAALQAALTITCTTTSEYLTIPVGTYNIHQTLTCNPSPGITAQGILLSGQGGTQAGIGSNVGTQITYWGRGDKQVLHTLGLNGSTVQDIIFNANGYAQYGIQIDSDNTHPSSGNHFFRDRIAFANSPASGALFVANDGTCGEASEMFFSDIYFEGLPQPGTTQNGFLANCGGNTKNFQFFNTQISGTAYAWRALGTGASGNWSIINAVLGNIADTAFFGIGTAQLNVIGMEAENLGASRLFSANTGNNPCSAYFQSVQWNGSAPVSGDFFIGTDTCHIDLVNNSFGGGSNTGTNEFTVNNVGHGGGTVLSFGNFYESSSDQPFYCGNGNRCSEIGQFPNLGPSAVTVGIVSAHDYGGHAGSIVNFKSLDYTDGIKFSEVNEFTGLTFANLPSTPLIGMQSYISDGKAANCGDTSCTTWGTTITGGGGALKLLAWYNGTNWTLIGK